MWIVSAFKIRDCARKGFCKNDTRAAIAVPKSYKPHESAITGFSLPFRQPEPSAVRVWQVAYHSLRVYAFSLAYAFLLRKHDPCLAG